jgi:UDP-glucose 6-dehydrogenase
MKGDRLRAAVVGAGYVGLATAVSLAEQGRGVVLVERDHDLIVVSTPEEALQGADAVVIATEWPIYRDLDWAAVRKTMRCPRIIDGRRLLPEAELRALGYTVERIGDGVTAQEPPTPAQRR